MVNKFKQTDIGPIPIDWDYLCVIDPQIGHVINGLTYKPENVKRNGTLVLRSANIKNGRLAFDDNVYVDCSIPQELFVRKNDVLICVRNGSRTLIGKNALIEDNLPVTFGAFMAILRSNIGEYVYFLFSSNIIQKQINVNCSATINQITKRDFKSFYVPIPQNTQEQKAIAEALSDIDHLIAATEKLIAKKKDIKKGLMQELMTGKRRVITGATEKVKASELGEIPADWDVLKISDVFRFITNNTHSRSAMNANGGKYRNIHYGDILTKYN
ncbi:MAG: restriction endonuclease subunit S [Lentisphaeria bacterium]|nr:restriction endonuclease subunit S [Lentisphaeria bacterium]